MEFVLLPWASLTNVLQNIGGGSIYQCPSSLPHWVSWIILIIKGTESASSLEMKPWVIFKRGALNFWWTVTETEITTIQKSHPLMYRDQHLWMISSNPLPSNFLPAPPPNKNTPLPHASNLVQSCLLLAIALQDTSCQTHRCKVQRFEI